MKPKRLLLPLTHTPSPHSTDFCEFGANCAVAGQTTRMCLSLCEDVVRKCPYVLAFTCPEVRLPNSALLAFTRPMPHRCPRSCANCVAGVFCLQDDTVDYSSEIKSCNKLVG